MASPFPNAIPAYDPFTTPITLQALQHTSRHRQMEEDIAAIATKVGIDGDTDPTTFDYIIAQLVTDVSGAQGDISTLQSDLTTLQALVDDIIDGDQALDAGVIGETQLAPNSVTTSKVLDEDITIAKLETAIQTKLGYLSAPDSGWNTLSLSNGWVSYDSTYGPPQYYKDALGNVHLRGLMKSGTTSAATVIATLPVGYRPTKNTIFAGIAIGRAVYDLRVNADGNVTLGDNGAPSSAWISVGGVVFPTI